MFRLPVLVDPGLACFKSYRCTLFATRFAGFTVPCPSRPGGGGVWVNELVCLLNLFFCHGFLTCGRTCSRLMYGIPLARDVYDSIALDILR